MYKKGDLLDKLCVRTLKNNERKIICPNKQVEKYLMAHFYLLLLNSKNKIVREPRWEFG